MLQIIQKFFPIETEILGVEGVEKIIKSNSDKQKIEIISSSDGRNIEMISIITTIGVAVQIVDFALRFKKDRMGTNNLSDNKNLKNELLENLDLSQNDLNKYETLLDEMFKDE